jgi:uncharacterized membrane protein
MIGGLFLNSLMLFINIKQPLTLLPLSIGINVTITPILIILIITNFKDKKFIQISNFSIKSIVSVLSPYLLLLFVISGSILLLNNVNNDITLIGLFIIAAVIISMTAMSKRFSDSVIISTISAISIYVLFMISLRGRSYFGSDILGENMVLEMTKQGGFWANSNLPGSLYNLCLSITILPTIISVLSNTSNVVIYKIIFPIILSFIPIIIFFFAKKYINKTVAFLSAIFFLSNPGYWNTMSTHLREGVSLLFFIMFLLVLYSKHSWKIRNILLLVFGVSAIFSHYTTAFIMMLWISLLYLFSFTSMLCAKIESLLLKERFLFFRKISFKSNISIYLLVIMWIIFVTWYTQIPTNLNEYVSRTLNNLKYTFSYDNESNIKADRGSITDLLNVAYKSNPQSILQNAFNDIKYKAITGHTLYPPSTYSDYKVTYVPPSIISSQFPIVIRSYSYYIGETIKRIGLVLSLIGLILLIFKKSYNLKVDKGYVSSVIIFGIFVLLSIIVPFISVGYDIGRVYIQALVFLAFPASFGAYALLSKLYKVRVVLLALFFSITFIVFTGALYYALGVTNSSIQFSNSGEEYDSLYIHSQEISSSEWLRRQNTNNFVYADIYSIKVFKLKSKLPNILYYNLLIPSLVPVDSYVYLGYTNTVKNEAFAYLNTLLIGYKVPNDFLYNNKDMIYSNGGSIIYK